MRIIAGGMKGREFRSPHSHKTHPMSDKVRGALFNVLGDVEGLTFLDAFAGSGALAFEAASRGASSVVAIDKDRSAHKILEENIKELRLSKTVHASKANTGGWSLHNMEKRFDIILLDPPYKELQIDLAERLVKRHLKPGGIAALSFPGSIKPEKLAGAEIVSTKNYGDAQLVFYRKK